jgi:hypothetical protein
LAILNSFSFDFYLRLPVTANVSPFIVNGCPIRPVKAIEAFLAHSALRLTCNNAGYYSLWREQLGGAWHERKPKFTWPALDDGERWILRVAIDVLVASSYGLERDQYAHVLSTFSHKSYPNTPELCLAAFDEHKVVGLDAFARKYDPYWDIPLNESLPKPVIDLPVPAETKPTRSEYGPLFDGTNNLPKPKPENEGQKRGTKYRKAPNV